MAFFDPGSYELLRECVHCGLCLQHCPTYRQLGVEPDSPRGRLWLMKGFAEGELEITRETTEHLYLCLVCRACETACPSGVRYGRLMDEARAVVERRVRRPLRERLTRRLIYSELFPHQRRLELGVSLLQLLQRSGLQGLIRRLPAKSSNVGQLAQMLPIISTGFFNAGRYPVVRPRNGVKHRVGFLSGCIMGTVFSPVNRATVRVLAANGCEVVTCEGQACCGALHLHEGEMETAKKLARRNIAAFERAGVEAVVVNSGGCGATMKEYGQLLEDDPEYAERARDFSQKVKDFSEFLAEIQLTPPHRRLDAVATYQDPCHLAHGQGVRKQPRELLSMIPGLSLVEMKDSDQCCGGAGLYSLLQPELSTRILDAKMESIRKTGADLIVTSNPPCLLQLTMGLRRHGAKARAVHIAELLDWSYRSARTQGSFRAGKVFNADSLLTTTL